MERANSAEPQILPAFVERFLQQHNVQYQPQPIASSYVETGQQSTLERSIETLMQARTFKKIDEVYRKFIDETFRAPVMLQLDDQQLIYPFFVHLALQLFQIGKKHEAAEFISKYEKYQPPQCRDDIERLKMDRENFRSTDFNIQMNQFALDDMMMNIEKWRQVLLSFIITTHINISVASYSHDLLFIDMESTAMGTTERTPVLNKIEQEAYEPPSLSVKFHPDDLNKQPSVEQDEKGIYLTQSLPDVAHVIAYNHNNRINDLRFSPCARLLAMAQDSSVVISSLDSSTGVNNSYSSTLINHAGKVLTTDFSSDSQFLVSGGMDCNVKISHLEAFKPVARFKHHLEPILNVAYDNRSMFFAAASQDKTVSMWSLSSPTILRLFLGHTLPVTKAIFSKDNSSIITCSNDLTLRVWDIGTAGEIARFRCGRSTPTAIGIHPNNQLIACGCDNGAVMLWDANQGRRLWYNNPFGTTITDVKFTSDGSLLLGSSIDGTLCAFNLKSEQGDVVMNIKAYASTIDSITVTKQNLVCTTGRSLKGNILI